MPSDDPNLLAAIEEVRSIVSADGGDIALVSADDGQVTLDLILDSAECRECVMPAAFLQTVALDMMKPKLPDLSAVIINDPRESEGDA